MQILDRWKQKSLYQADGTLRDVIIRAVAEKANLTEAYLTESIYEAKWGIPADPYTAFVLLSLKVSVPQEISRELLLTPDFCWSNATKYVKKYPELFKELETLWPELFEKLTSDIKKN